MMERNIRHKQRVVAVVEARMASTRLPGKALKKVLGRPLLSYLIERLRRCVTLDKIIIATTTNLKDDILASFCETEGYTYYRGSENDVLGRVVEAAALAKTEIYVEIFGDCPLIDPAVIDQHVRTFIHGNYDVVTNCAKRSFPAGMDCIVCSYDLLKLSAHIALNERYREHVMLYILENMDRFKMKNLLAPKKYSRPWLRILVDYPEDFQVIKTIIEELYPKNTEFGLKEIIELVDSLSLDKINDKVWPKNVIGLPARKNI